MRRLFCDVCEEEIHMSQDVLQAKEKCNPDYTSHSFTHTNLHHDPGSRTEDQFLVTITVKSKTGDVADVCSSCMLKMIQDHFRSKE